MYCTEYRCSMGEAACGTRHLNAKAAWKRELASRKFCVGKSRDRGQFSKCRECPIGAANAATNPRVCPAPRFGGRTRLPVVMEARA